MTQRFLRHLGALLFLILGIAIVLWSQTADNSRPAGSPRPSPVNGGPQPGGPDFGGPPPFGQGGPGGPGPGGFGGVQPDILLVAKFDADGDKRLNVAERKAAREYLHQQNAGRRGPRPSGPGFPNGDNESTPTPGPKLTPADVKSYPNAPLYDPFTFRTFFLEFENADWEKEMADFKDTDVEVPAKLTVDGGVYPEVGVHFRGMSSFNMVSEGRKRSLNLSLDFVNTSQNLGGYRTINLLNSHGDPTFLRAVLFFQIAREYIPAPRANFVRMVINGESWGIYINSQQFNKDFARDFFETTKGERWKAPGSPGGQASLNYLGDDVREYQRRFEIKTKDDPKSWGELIRLCKVLNETPADHLEQALAPILDVEGVLKYLALDNVFVNGDGYWVRSSDYNLYRDVQGRFHLIPYDSNETFRPAEGPGMGGGPPGGPPGMGGPPDMGGGLGGPGGFGPGRGEPDHSGGARTTGLELDPLVAINDSSKPLIAKLLAVPALRTRYLGFVREIAITWLDWKKLGPLAEKYQTLIAADVKADTRKLDSFEEFTNGLASATVEDGGGFGRGRSMSLKTFAEQRRAFLLNHKDIKNLAAKR